MSSEENIRFGKLDATHEEVVRASRIAGAEDFILRRLPNGYETRVGTNGTKLSGGQRQRIGIARAIIRRPRVLVFDEATSSIDPISIERIMESLERLRGECTIVLISHQLSTLQRLADRIVVMKEGRIAEIGTHEELMRANGLYHALVSIQQRADEAV
jgi:ABC-type multidrug transport system fused ATPase/permease subunit